MAPPFRGQVVIPLLSLFQGGAYSGFLFDDLAKQSFQDSSLTQPESADGQPVGGAKGAASYLSNAVQATSSAKPTFKAAAGSVPAYWSCDGGDYLATTTVPTASMTFAICFNSTSKSKTVFGTAAANGGYGFRVNSSGSLSGAVNGVGLADPADVSNAGVVALIRYTGGSFDFFVNSSQIGSAAYTGLTTDNPFTIGGSAIGFTEFMTGKVYRALAINRFLSDAEVTLAVRALGAGVVSL